LSLFPNCYGAPCNDSSAENCTAVQPADCNFTIAASNDLHAWQGNNSELFGNGYSQLPLSPSVIRRTNSDYAI
jgi:hypothetical protein